MRSSRSLVITLWFLAVSLGFSCVGRGNCQFLNRRLGDQVRKPEASDGVSLWSQYQQKKSEVLESLAQTYVDQITHGKAWTTENSEEPANDCTPFTRDDWEDFLAIVQTRFTTQILNQIRSLGPLARTFVDDAETAGVRKHVRIFGAIDPNKTEEQMRAGYHRGRQTVHLDISQVAPAERWLVLVHELAHRKDKALERATKIYARPDLLSLISKIVKSELARHPIPLTPALQDQVDEWLIAGLDRGFLAEVRAWTVTLEIYAEARSNSENKIPWVEQWLDSRRQAEGLSEFVLRSLNDRFPDPTISPFNSHLIRARLKKLRQEYLNGARTVGSKSIF